MDVEEITHEKRRTLTCPPFFVVNRNSDIKQSFTTYVVTLNPRYLPLLPS
jgi:hypothetical protein